MSVAFQHRVRNRHPDGGLSGDGTSPFNRIRSPRCAASSLGAADIRAAVVAGAADGPAAVEEIGDRSAAIDFAVGWAREGDVVLVAGKGHEAGQTSHGLTRPFDDRDELARALQALGVQP